MDIVKSAILGVVEGITEFIPVSSTGHLILAAKFLKFEGSAVSTFEVFIQLGAILAVIILYRKTFQSFLKFDNQEEFSGLRGLELLFWTTLPALVFGAAAHGTIKKYLFSS
ncbi:MAG: undecaprenyl-diphosphatase, partial [Elusimicrobia bacterium]|nr:undecaprenyl-diphosphatase [Elusimicrobiota bacterium]